MVVFLMMACGEPKGEGGDVDSGVVPYEAELLDLEEALEGYESWNQLPDWEGIQASDTSHDNYTEIWFNDIAWDTLQAAAGEDMPDGAVIAKQSYKDEAGAELANFTVMMKTDGEWFWAAFNPAGENVQAGQPSFCVDCHAPGQDSVLVTTW